MIVMLDTPQDLDVCARELGAPVEQFFSPQTYRLAQQPERHFAIDNGAFGNFDGALFLRLLARESSRRDLCRFVAVPDVVGCAERTAAVFEVWSRKITEKLGEWSLAYVAQDGQERSPIPWDQITTLFIGGTTAWKTGKVAEACIKDAQERGKRVHVGRVNTPGRFEWCKERGVDSMDGTGLARYSHMREKVWLDQNAGLFNAAI